MWKIKRYLLLFSFPCFPRKISATCTTKQKEFHYIDKGENCILLWSKTITTIDKEEKRIESRSQNESNAMRNQ